MRCDHRQQVYKDKYWGNLWLPCQSFAFAHLVSALGAGDDTRVHAGRAGLEVGITALEPPSAPSGQTASRDRSGRIVVILIVLVAQLRVGAPIGLTALAVVLIGAHGDVDRHVWVALAEGEAVFGVVFARCQWVGHVGVDEAYDAKHHEDDKRLVANAGDHDRGDLRVCRASERAFSMNRWQVEGTCKSKGANTHQ
jgi:hypothetical protein